MLIHFSFLSFDQEEQKRIEEAKEKRKENDQVFKAWLQKKREQVLEMRRIQRAKQMENLNSRVSSTLHSLGMGLSCLPHPNLAEASSLAPFSILPNQGSLS